MSNARSRLAAYGRTPKELLRDPNIRPIAKIVYAMVDEVAGHEDITIERLSEWLGVNVKTARRALHEIAQAGWVEVGTVIEAQRGQVASEYVANAYPFQHLSDAEDISSTPQVADQAERPAPLPLSSAPVEESGTPPSQKVLTEGSGQTGVPKSGTPRACQKVGGPTSLRDDETSPPTSSPTGDGFREFWAQYPDTGYKGRKDDCRKIWTSLDLEARRDAYRALMAYKNSELWEDTARIPSPLTWLDNDPWLLVKTGNLPKAKPDTRIKWTDPATYRLED